VVVGEVIAEESQGEARMLATPGRQGNCVGAKDSKARAEIEGPRKPTGVRERCTRGQARG
jgi:hypothetical protein